MPAIIQPPLQQSARPSKQVIKKILLSRWTFVVLQVFDLATTLVAFRSGGVEANPLVAHLTAAFGRFNGVLISKIMAIVIAMGVRKRLWIINLFYAGIIFWNILVFISMSSH
jgi:Domain of unknown function (DUF5658)